MPAGQAPAGASQPAPAPVQPPPTVVPSAPSAGAERSTDANAAAHGEVTLFDPSLRTRKRKPGLNLFQMGAVPQEHRTVVEDRQAEAQAAAATSVPEDAPALPPEPIVISAQEPPPTIEWWDAAVLDQPDYAPGPDGSVRLKDTKLTNLIEHPVPIEPPVEKPPPPPQALKLTKKVRAWLDESLAVVCHPHLAVHIEPCVRCWRLLLRRSQRPDMRVLCKPDG